jgi:DNA transposition AAA+ family ATPase
MPSGDNRVSLLAKLRERAQERVSATSLRHVADDIGISHHALHRFLNGAKPHTVNRKQLERWYEAEADKVERLERENAELRKALAECEGKLGKG